MSAPIKGIPPDIPLKYGLYFKILALITSDCAQRLLDALYFLMTTLTTIGYGDFYPHTTGTRLM